MLPNDYLPFTKHLRHAGRLPLFAILVVAALLTLAGCGPSASQAPTPNDQGGGGSSPELVAEYFFDDLRDALKDPQLANDEKRGQWGERLASYFAPSERDEQRIALRSTLDSFATGLGKLDANETLTLDLRFDSIRKLSESGDHATVQPINGSIDVLITRTTASGVDTLYKDSVGLDRVIGGDQGAVPVVRIGRSWYLTEG